MRKFILMLILVWALALPFNARAASNVALDDLKIQLWPDYDRLSVLVIYDFSLQADTPLPVAVRFRLPIDGDLAAVAKESDTGLLTVQHNVSAGQDGNTVTFTVSEKTGYHLEYYIPYTLENQTRDFTFTWPGDYAVKSFTLALQRPSAATNLTTEPALAKVQSDQDGFAYSKTSSLTLEKQKPFTIHVRYDNNTDTLSASTLSVKPSAPLTDNLPGQVPMMTYFPWILVGLAVILIVGGIGWYWFSSRGSNTGADSSKPRRRRIATPKSPAPAAQERQVYCHECGKRAQPDDRFCRTCGTELRKDV